MLDARFPSHHGAIEKRTRAFAAGAPLAPGKCRANFLILVTSEPEELLAKLRKRDPQIFTVHDGEGTVQHFFKTDRPIRVWYNWSYADDGGTAQEPCG